MLRDYDFIEIGTSDFDTLIQKANDNTIGISIEPLTHYLERLPSPKNCIKVNCAISFDGSAGKTNVYYIPEELIESNRLAPWLRGCNSIGDYHYQHTTQNIKHLVNINEVDQVPLSKILDDNHVRGISLLKIDTEGGDCYILQSFVPYLESHTKEYWPKRILFESNILTPENIIQETVDIYQELGYNLIRRDNENALLGLV